jgi:hypothetical protein
MPALEQQDLFEEEKETPASGLVGIARKTA